MRSTVIVRGTSVPKIGLGTWKIVGPDCVAAVRSALDLGYRHIDTASVYENEAEVGRGIADSSIAREDVWLTTKVWMDDASPDRLRRSVETSLRMLQTDYLDMLLLHWPSSLVPLGETLGAMVLAREEGLIRQLGVSNFPSGMLEQALAIAPVFCNQVEFHPFLGQDRLLEVCRRNDVLLAAYAPLCHGEVLRDRTLRAIAQSQDVSPAQVALRWLLDHDHVCALPKAVSSAHQRTNLDPCSFVFTDDARRAIAALPKDQRRFSPAWAPDWTL